MNFRRLRTFGLVALTTLVAADVTLRIAAPQIFHDPFFHRNVENVRDNVRGLNNYLLRAREPYPRARRPGEYVIGVFGGSMAEMFAMHSGNFVPETPSASALERRLGKRLKIVNMALGGGAEPAQYNLLHLFGGEIDAAVFLDGFNDLSFDSGPRRPGACDAMADFWRHDPDVAGIVPLALRARRDRADWATHAWWSSIAFASGLFRLYLYRETITLSTDLNAWYRTLDLPAARNAGPLSPPERVDAWAHCVELSDAYARAHNLPIYFFVQPNQYVKDSKPFSAEEQAQAFRRRDDNNDALAWAFSQTLDGQLRELAARADAMHAKGVRSISLLNVFRDHHETLYVDTCCHVNHAGEVVIGEAIIAALLEDLDAAH